MSAATASAVTTAVHSAPAPLPSTILKLYTFLVIAVRMPHDMSPNVNVFKALLISVIKLSKLGRLDKH